MRLDKKPKDWEQRVALFCAFLVDSGHRSATVKSYVSAIKCVLKLDGYKWCDNMVLLDSLTRACRLINDRVFHRLPIHKGLLEILLFEFEHMFLASPFLEVLYKAVFAMGYYGLMRAGELAFDCGEFSSNHAVKAKNVHIGQNKAKVMIVLYTSKTHGKESRPQKIKIAGSSGYVIGGASQNRNFCPFQLIKDYMTVRGSFDHDDEQFFIFRDRSQIQPVHIRRVLKEALSRLNLDASMYDLHVLRIGRCTDLIKMGFSIEHVKHVGRWRSNAVYKYIKL